MTLENVSLHCNKEFQSTTAKNIYIYLKLTVDLLLRAMMPFFFLQLPGLPCMNYEIVIHKAWGP